MVGVVWVWDRMPLYSTERGGVIVDTKAIGVLGVDDHHKTMEEIVLSGLWV